MSRRLRHSTDVLGFLLLWALVSLLAFSPALPGDTLGSLLAGVFVTLVVIAAHTVRRTDDLLFGLSRTPRGPTVAEQRLRGAFRRQSRPDTPGRPRSRAPGPGAGAATSRFA
ncbi:DUF6412 domain-containing protein [Rhodococcus sp. (in: high G+C Gram-positive bacteria)]|uniref:DUF6412 domain-containing protein n=1 Tax=Rhodococcus sp. TaxID=1831 RepID=UPI00388E4B28